MRLFNSAKLLRQNKRRGVSLIIAMCASALLLGLSLSIIYSASLPLARANNKVTRERSYQLAKSFAEVLDYELLRYETENNEVSVVPEKFAPDASFYRYANRVLDGIYGEYDPDNPDITTYYYTSSTGAEIDHEKYGHITVKLRKESVENDEDTVLGGEFEFEESVAKTDDAENQTFIRYLFYVDTTVTLDSESYTYSTEYYRKDRFVPHYTWEGELSGTTNVEWDGENWHRLGETAVWERQYHDEYIEVPDGDGTTRLEPNENPIYPESVTISYEYRAAPEDIRDNPNEITYKIFEQTYLTSIANS